MKTDVSIVILNFNTFEMTCKCMQSVIDQTLELNYEIILVDNASNECDPGLFSARFPQIKLIKSEENLGFAKGNNLGIKHSEAEVILLLNSDTILKNNAIKICYNELMKDNQIGVVTCKLLSPDGSIQHQCNKFERISLFLLEKLRAHKLLSKQARAKILLNGYFDHNNIAYPERIWGTFFMFKRDMLSNFPGKKLSDRFFMYGEDNEWCYQIKRFTKYKILYFPAAEICHYMGASLYGSKMTNEKNLVINRNKYICMGDYYGKWRTKIYFILKGINNH